jgi:hypothetical protein
MNMKGLIILPLILCSGIMLGHLMQVLASPAQKNPGHDWGQMDCDTNLCVNVNNNRVGVGTTNPQYDLDVTGNLHTSGKLIVDKDLEVGGDIKTSNNRFYATNIASGDYYWFGVNEVSENNLVLGLYSDSSGNNKKVTVNGDFVVMGNFKGNPNRWDFTSFDSTGDCQGINLDTSFTKALLAVRPDRQTDWATFGFYESNDCSGYKTGFIRYNAGHRTDSWTGEYWPQSHMNIGLLPTSIKSVKYEGGGSGGPSFDVDDNLIVLFYF